MTDSQKAAIWDILTEYGATEINRESFMQHFPCSEFRFQGVFGFGGKIRSQNKTISVTCYPEDATAERKEKLTQINQRLAAITED